MKFTATLCGLAALLTLAVADAPIKNSDISADIVVPNKYIVTYKAGTDSTERKTHEGFITKKAKQKNKKGVVDTISIGKFQGYVVEIPPSELQDITKSKLVDYVEVDSIVNTTRVAAEYDHLKKRAFTTQLNAPWGLARISQKAGGNTGAFGAGYYYDGTAGTGVRVYVVDTGIRTTHTEFGGRAVWGANFITGSPNTDENGHGTHVSGTIAGKTFGVAKLATVVAVKVLDKNGSGTMSGLILGLNWAVSNAKSRGIANKAVVNMSVGGAYTASVNTAVKAATDAGLTVVVAAGNNGDDASLYSPSSAPSAITVGAVEGTNFRTWFSNYGSLVDIFAPGSSILSSYHLSDTSSRYLAGTSMASPHVAGLAAYFIAKEGLSGSTAVTNRILNAAVAGVVADPVGSWNRVAYNAGGQ
ncbi:peptidase S8/S53 domain-containing protein [Dactylonectria macrodidyma]|uniref:Peptidase S8/S53 domain-containing protein n=1 Tax=Dactylonectria macrodidyma TaxID=307937 RepID=A0A9P9EHS6_9HYPO|nr:peptidase S8/S53 domain-containing protein [Dactylonectria macrodidyma]